METIVKTNIEFIISTLSTLSIAKNNLYLVPSLVGIIKTEGKKRVYWNEAVIEMGRLLDYVRVNKCERSTEAVVADLSVLLPLNDILSAVSIIHATFENPYSKEKIKQSVLNAQTIIINRAMATLNP
jgi:hypothetical protein